MVEARVKRILPRLTAGGPVHTLKFPPAGSTGERAWGAAKRRSAVSKWGRFSSMAAQAASLTQMERDGEWSAVTLLLRTGDRHWG